MTDLSDKIVAIEIFAVIIIILFFTFKEIPVGHPLFPMFFFMLIVVPFSIIAVFCFVKRFFIHDL